MDYSDPEAAAALLPDFVPLAECSESYFLPTSASTEIPLDLLVSTRLREEGVRNASRHMADAGQGRVPRRAPISVARRDDGKWDVIDGNSTVAVARLSGWGSIPCAEVGA